MASKEQIRQAIESKGILVPSNTPLSQYAAKIRQKEWRAHDNLISICSNPGAISYFPNAGCSSYTYTANTYIWEGTSCPLASGTASIYGNARCSNQIDSGYGYGSALGRYRSVSYEPTDDRGTGEHCWCQLCTTNGTPRTNCGGWVLLISNGGAAYCLNNCANRCGYFVREVPASRLAFCAPPIP